MRITYEKGASKNKTSDRREIYGGVCIESSVLRAVNCDTLIRQFRGKEGQRIRITTATRQIETGHRTPLKDVQQEGH